MFTTLIFMIFTAFYFCYNASAKVKIADTNTLFIQLRQNKRLSYGIAIFVLLFAFIASLWLWGIASGTFAYFAVLMGVGCVIVLIAPFEFLKWHHVLLIFICSLILEIAL